MKKIFAIMLALMLFMLPICGYGEQSSEYPVGLWAFDAATYGVVVLCVTEDGTVYSSIVPYLGDIETGSENYDKVGKFVYNKAADVLIMQGTAQFSRLASFVPDPNGDLLSGVWALRDAGVIAITAYDGTGNVVSNIYTNLANYKATGSMGTYEISEGKGYYQLTVMDYTNVETVSNFSIMDKYLTLMPSDGSGAAVFEKFLIVDK